MKSTKNSKRTSPLFPKNYIFPATLRKYYNLGGFFTLVTLFGFAFFMMVIGIKQEQDKTPCFLVSVIFGILDIGYWVIWIRSYHLINATYYKDNCVLFNCCSKTQTKISVNLSSVISKEYTQPFYIGKGKFSVDYIIFSNNTHFESVLSDAEGTNVYKTLKKLWETGAVIIPKSS